MTKYLNTIQCGDFLHESKKIESVKFNVVIADPPYNIGKDFGNSSDNQSMQDYINWSQKWISICMDHLTDSGVIYAYGFAEILAHVAVKYPIDRQHWLVWHYTNKAVPSSKFWQRSHESILCLWKNKRPILNIDEIREEYTDSYKRVIGTTRKDTSGRFSRTGKKTIYDGHVKGALPRDVIKLPALAGGAGNRERWFVCRDCENKLFAPSEKRNHLGHDILQHPTQKPMKLTKRLLSSVVRGGGRAMF